MTQAETYQITEEQVEQYAAIAEENDALKERIAQLEAELAEANQYSASLVTDQAESYAALQQQVLHLTEERSDATRRERLRNLADRFAVVDYDAETQLCCYSAGSEMSDTQFEQHCEMIEKYAAASVVQSPLIPIGDDGARVGQPSRETAQYAAAIASEARDIIDDAVRAGEKPPTWDQAKAQAAERRAS